MHKLNRLLALDVKEALGWDPMLDDSRVVVQAHDGDVTLSGSVPTYSDKIRATDTAWSVRGVKRVDNELLVGLLAAKADDRDLERACETALAHERAVPKGTVAVAVSGGYAVLHGRVPHSFQRHAAEAALVGVEGIRGIDNRVSVVGAAPSDDLAARIRQAFLRSSTIDDTKITITLDDRSVVLDGTVRSYSAMQEAVRTAQAAPGVAGVVNRLVIEQ